MRTAASRLSAPLWILAAIATAFFLRETRQLFVPLTLALLASYALYPLVCRTERLRLPRAAGAALVVGGLLAVIGWAAWTLRDDVARGARELPEQIRQVREQLQSSTGGGLLSRLREASRELQRTSAEAGMTPQLGGGAQSGAQSTTQAATSLGWYLWQGSFGLAALAGQLTVFVFFLYFFLLGAESWRTRLVKLFGTAMSSRRTGTEVLDEINEQVRRFLLVRLLTTVIVGGATWAVLLWFGAPAPAMWAIAAGLLNWIPYFGPVIVSAGLAIVGFVAGGLTMAAELAGAALVITTLEGWLITPPLLGRAAQMNTLAILTSLLFWSWVWGVWGTILAVPLTAMVKAVADHVESLTWLSELLSDRDGS